MKLSELSAEQYELTQIKYQWHIRNARARGGKPKDFDVWYQELIDKQKYPWNDIRTKQKDFNSRLRYHRHRAQAKFRKIPFELTWEQWHNWWLDHGYDRNQLDTARGADRMCMCRYGDTGGYSLDNIYLASIAENNADAQRNGVRRGGRPKGSKNKPKG